MKTKITSIIMIALSCLSLKAQIPNGGFESWTGSLSTMIRGWSDGYIELDKLFPSF